MRNAGGIVLLVSVVAGCSNPGRKITLRQIVAKVRGPSTEALAQMLLSDDPDVRRSGLEQLSSKESRCREPFLNMYATVADDPAPTVRGAALRALAKGGDPKYVPKVTAALNDPVPAVRWDAAGALDTLISDAAVGPLSQAALNDRSPDVRIAAAKALRHHRRPEVLEALLGCLADREFAVRFRAAESLRELTGQDGGTDEREWREILAGRDDPFAPPPPPEQPWWRKIRKLRWRKPAPQPAAAQPGAEPSSKPKRPWWDWFGVTQK
jgi:hypothetical protein